MSSSTRAPQGLTLWFALLFEGAMIPLALILAWILGVRVLDAFWVDWVHLGIGLAGVLPMLCVFALLWNATAEWVREIHTSIRELIIPLFRHSRLIGPAAVSLLAGVGEELLFRGVIQEALTDPLGPFVALIIASVLFGLVHWITPGYGLIATLVGFYLGLLYLWTGNLLVPMVVHAVYNFLILRVYLYRYSPKRVER